MAEQEKCQVAAEKQNYWKGVFIYINSVTDFEVDIKDFKEKSLDENRTVGELNRSQQNPRF